MILKSQKSQILVQIHSEKQLNSLNASGSWNTCTDSEEGVLHATLGDCFSNSPSVQPQAKGRFQVNATVLQWLNKVTDCQPWNPILTDTQNNTPSSCHSKTPTTLTSQTGPARPLQALMLKTVAYQVPPSIGFSRQEYWSGLPENGEGNEKWAAVYIPVKQGW